MTCWDRIKPELDARGWSVQKFADVLGVSYQAVVKIRNGGAFSAINNIKAAAALNISSTWLATGKGPKHIRYESNVEPGPTLRGRVPLITWVHAGAMLSATDPLHPGEAERWMDCPVSHSPRSFALRVRGDSMTAAHGRSYPEGCIIFVDPERCTPANGDRVIARVQGSDEVTFKLYKHEDGRQWLQPLNPAHEPIRTPFDVVGTVLGKWEDG